MWAGKAQCKHTVSRGRLGRQRKRRTFIQSDLILIKSDLSTLSACSGKDSNSFSSSSHPLCFYVPNNPRSSSKSTNRETRPAETNTDMCLQVIKKHMYH